MFMIVGLFQACSDESNKYYIQVIPDSLKAKAAQFEIDIVKANTASSYGEDPDCWIPKAEVAALNLYGVWYEAILSKNRDLVPIRPK